MGCCLMELLAPIFKAFLLVFVAEFGDKSQLVCMTLSARYRPMPVILGAVVAFSFLNLLAVTVGVALANWLPGWVVLCVVALLFSVFGVQALRQGSDDEEEATKVGKHLLISVFILIFFAELGDKTQLAVAGMAGIEWPVGVWLGGTLALVLTTVIGVVAGRTLFRRLPLFWIHKVSGSLFLIFGLVAWFKLWVLLN